MPNIEKLKDRKVELEDQRAALFSAMDMWRDKLHEAQHRIEELDPQVKEEHRKSLIGAPHQLHTVETRRTVAWHDVQVAQAHIQTLGFTAEENKERERIKVEIRDEQKLASRLRLRGSADEKRMQREKIATLQTELHKVELKDPAREHHVVEAQINRELEGIEHDIKKFNEYRAQLNDLGIAITLGMAGLYAQSRHFEDVSTFHEALDAACRQRYES